MNMISALTSGDKSIPGVLLTTVKTEDGEEKLKVCYSDGHKSLIKEIDVELEDSDYLGKVVVSYEALSRAIANCQPSGSIKVDQIEFEYAPGNIIVIKADLSVETKDAEGNVVGQRVMANKRMDVAWVEPGSNMKASILTRMDYDALFTDPEAETADHYIIGELTDALSRTSVEKNRAIYLSTKTQKIFVSNTAHLTAVPIQGYDMTQERLDEIRGQLVENGTYSDEAFEAACANERNRMHSSVVIPQNIAKAIISILGQTSADKNSDEVQLYTKSRYCVLYMDTEDDKLAIWFEMAQGSKTHIGALERYNSLQYQSFQLMFMREFLENSIKSALAVTKSDKIKFKFEPTESDQAVTELDLVIEAGSASASVVDKYKVNPSEINDPTNSLAQKEFNVSLKVFWDMLSQLKTEFVALDFDIQGTPGNELTCIRLAEVDTVKMQAAYMSAREGLQDGERTPLDKKMAFRESTLNVVQYAMLTR